MAQPPQKLCVILGAGASYDVGNSGSPVANFGLRPPLARELFDFANRDEFRAILAEYEGAVVLAQSLAPKASDSSFDLEQELKRIAEHPNHLMREHYKHIPPYLRDLLLMCSYEYTSYPSCYVQLVQAVLVEEPSDVLFLVLNYDDLLEQALYLFTEGAISFESLDDYVRADRSVRVVKLHGSINWFRPIGPQNGQWKTLVKGMDVLTKPPDSEIHVATKRGKSDQARAYAIEIAGQRGYPVLTAPLAGKGVAAAVCPDTHLETTRQFLSDCRRFLVIVSSGIDLDLLDLLKQSMGVSSPWVQFVSGSVPQGKEVSHRFASKGLFGAVMSVDGNAAFGGGFERYVSSGALLTFLGASSR